MTCRLTILTALGISLLWGYSVQAQLLPTTETKIQLSKTKTLRLDAAEVIANKDWALLWHWLNHPGHEKFKKVMIRKFPHYTYEDGGDTKFKRALSLGVEEDKQSAKKADHFLTHELLSLAKLRPFFAVAQGLYCNDSDTDDPDYCEIGANRREAWETQMSDRFTGSVEFEKLGTVQTMRHANQALAFHKHLECTEEGEEETGVTMQMTSLIEQLKQIGHYLKNEIGPYNDKRLEMKRIHTLNRIQQLVNLDSSGTDSSTHLAGNKDAVEEPQAEAKKENAKTNVPKTSTNVTVPLDSKSETPPSNPSHSETLTQLQEFTERLSQLDWADRKKALLDSPNDVYPYYASRSEEDKQNFKREEHQFYLEKFHPLDLTMKAMYSGAKPNLPQRAATKQNEILRAITESQASTPIPLKTEFLKRQRETIELIKWAKEEGQKLKSNPHPEDKDKHQLNRAGIELETKATDLEKAREKYENNKFNPDPGLELKFRTQFYQLKAIQENLKKLAPKALAD